MPKMHPDLETDLDARAFADLATELERARVKFPSAGNHMLAALVEEVGELAEALMQNGNNGAGHADVRNGGDT